MAAGAPWLWFLVRGWWVGFDVVAIALPVLALGGAVALLLVAVAFPAARAAAGVVCASVTLAAASAIVAPWVPQRGPAPTEPLRFAAANTFLGNLAADRAAAVIIDLDADVVVTVETSLSARSYLTLAFPYEVSSPDWRAQVNIWSRWPLADVEPLPGLLEGYGSRAVVERPAGAFAVYAVHLPRPWLTRGASSVPLPDHRRLVDALRVSVEAEALPTVLAGDLNLVDRSSGYRSLARTMRDAVRSGWTGPTSVKRSLRLFLPRIDHVFVTREWCAEGGDRFDVPGSDHRGVVARIGSCPSAAGGGSD
jgi:vancomycin resistance protein VanJ